MAESSKTRIQITVDEKTKRLIELIKEDSKGVTASEIYAQGVWLYAKERSPESLIRLEKERLESVK